VLLLLVAGCAGGSAAREPGGGAADGEVTGTLTVLAAASDFAEVKKVRFR
jgi:hypothetical protein